MDSTYNHNFAQDEYARTVTMMRGTVAYAGAAVATTAGEFKYDQNSNSISNNSNNNIPNETVSSLPTSGPSRQMETQTQTQTQTQIQISNHHHNQQQQQQQLLAPRIITKGVAPTPSRNYNYNQPNYNYTMEAVVFNSGHGGGGQNQNQNQNNTHNHNNTDNHNPFFDHSFRGIGAEISRNYANNLGILNAETYHAEGTSSNASSSKGPNKRNKAKPAGETNNMVFGFTGEMRLDSEELESKNGNEYGEPETTRRKKRPRIENHNAGSADEDEDARKKARGRPRVDTKDETAADRRRTQIRLAQRAYRHRKETTISSLEKQVQELRGTNEEMSSIFITLHDFAVAKGLLKREPEFGQQLQSTTQRFLALAKASSEYLSQDEGHPEEPEKQDRVVDEQPATTKKKKRAPKSPSPKTKPEEVVPPIPLCPYTVGAPTSELTNPAEEIQPDYHSQDYGDMTRPDEHQIITRPTLQNASFPYDYTDYQQYRVDVPSMDDFSQYFLPESQLQLPETHSHHELSFARRLQRQAAETGLRIVMSPDLPVEEFQRIWGFAALYESKPKIIARLKRVIAGSSKDSLQNWRAPYVHIGGAGTFYPMHEDDVNEELMPKLRTGYSMGPFEPSVAQVQEVVDDDFRTNFPGFEGEFFDPNDVEGYLRGRGLDIPPSADVITVQIDFPLLSESSSKSPSSTSATTIASPATPKSSIQNLLVQPQSFDDSYNLNQNQLSSEGYSFSLTQPKQFPGMKENDNIEPSFFSMPDPLPETDPPSTIPGTMQKSTIVMNVETLLFELISRAVCLGRSPGFRPSDVNAAIVAAAKAGYSV